MDTNKSFLIDVKPFEDIISKTSTRYIITGCATNYWEVEASHAEFDVQVSLAIRRGNVPEEFGIREYQNHQFRLKLCFFPLFFEIFPCYLVRE